MLASFIAGTKTGEGSGAPYMTDVNPLIGPQIKPNSPFSGKERRTVAWRGVRLDKPIT